jgi:hypothetical protein
VAPERELIRRIAPWSLPAAVVAFGLGTWIGGADAGWSVLIAVAVVFGNFVAHGWSLALAAAISPTVLYAVGLGGFVVRLGLVVVVIALLEQTAWFSVVAFIAALVPTTIALLVVEMKMLSGRLQTDLWTIPSTERGVAR